LRAALNSDVIFDLKNYGNDVNFKLFEVERSSDLLVASFSYNELQNGTYTTWLGGANGNLLRWKDGVSGKQLQGSKLVGTGLNPCLLQTSYLDDATEFAGMYNIGDFDVPLLTGTYCVSLILHDELNGSSQRLNLGIRGNDGGFFGFALQPESGYYSGRYYFKTTDFASGDSPDGYGYKIKNGYKVVVFKITDSYVDSILVDGAIIPITRSTAENYVRVSELQPKMITLGTRGLDTSGRINRYKEVGYHPNGNPATISAELNAIHSIY